MTQKRAFGLAGLLGLVAAVLAWGLISAGREESEPHLVSYEAQYIDGPAMLNLTETLSSDALQGRRVGSEGSEAARGFIHKRFETIGLRTIGDDYFHPFAISAENQAKYAIPSEGVNVIGWLAGETPGEGNMIVVTAHYDSLGVIDGEIYNGADDNASGTAAMIAVAEYFVHHRPKHDIIFAALDDEEYGELGARDLVDSVLIDQDRIAININIDMVSRSEAGELYVAGTYHTPMLLPLMQELAAKAPVKLLAGHDTPELGYDDWTTQSDHVAFHEAGIPFLYFGVEDHAGYHQPSDDYVNLTHDFFVRAGDTMVMAVLAVDDWIE